MTVVREVVIERFRGIAQLRWLPRPGTNCLIGKGDSGKTSLLDALMLLLSPTRRDVFYDTDFYKLDAASGFVIRATITDFPDELHDLERYGDYLRGWSECDGATHDEPSPDLLDALTLQLAVNEDLEGRWSLFSERTQDREEHRDLSLPHRALIAPVTLNQEPASHLRWSRQSILQRLSSPKASIRSLIAQAARGLRDSQLDMDDEATEAVVAQVQSAARSFGVTKAAEATVQIDAFGVPGWNAALGLHDAAGVPLRRLGTGSSRLLVAGLFQSLVPQGGIALIDEVEHGLEPYRLARLLRSLGLASANGGQVFMTTHSPLTLRELSADELFVVRAHEHAAHEVCQIGNEQADHVQGLVRACPNAFLSPSVVVAEGQTEEGLLRGLDSFWHLQGADHFAFCGVAVENGGGVPKAAQRAPIFAGLGYRTLLFVDSDVPLTAADRTECERSGVAILEWGNQKATEQALFAWLAWDDVVALLRLACQLHGQIEIDNDIRTHSSGQLQLETCLANDDVDVREVLGGTAKTRGWFKRIDHGQHVGQEIVGPGLARAAAPLREVLLTLRTWVDHD